MLRNFKNYVKKIKDFFFPTKWTGPFLKVVQIKGTNYDVTEMTTGDIKELLALEKEIYDGKAPWPRSAFLMELNSFFNHLYLVVRKEDELVAFIGCRISKEDAHITNLAVKPKFQKKGLATYLLEQAKQFALFNDCQQLSLEVRVSNHDAKRLYRKFGFVSTNIRKNYYTENNEDAVEMKYDLHHFD